ncbi:Prefoldin subunit 4 [Spironucleus salmonicida]|uniref:Prefoldin subunit 4 n=1 Tax=Spironucleus salmonicida TaxID=348837 RepID=V6LX64_9EUKA|nr:Prefoldin subunit 4 [Spironucleus salmonicida]|eukprot:EST49212.1 Prefoldin subunit 4 [Spironucleus salmonicida]
MLPKNVVAQEVLPDDQQRINAFSRFHMRYNNLKNQINSLKKASDDLESANIAVMDSDDLVFIRLGTGFLPLESLEVDDLLEQRKTVIQEEMDTIVVQMEKLAGLMDQSRTILERKFGQAINLVYEK